MSTEIPALLPELSSNVKYCIGVDPGGKTRKHSVGVAVLSNADGKLLYLPGQMTSNQFDDWLFEQNPENIECIICEDYINLPFKQKATFFNRNETSQMIGTIKSWCRRNDVVLILQRSDVLPMAEKHFQVQMPKNHDNSHKISAYLHVSEYLLRRGIKPSQLEREVNATEDSQN